MRVSPVYVAAAVLLVATAVCVSGARISPAFRMREKIFHRDNTVHLEPILPKVAPNATFLEQLLGSLCASLPDRNINQRPYQETKLFRRDSAEFIEHWPPSPTAPMPEVIDVVYTWTNRTDPQWVKEFQNTLKSVHQPCFDPLCLGHPTSPHELLRYSLRSIKLFLPWVRHIYLVTDMQLPAFMNEEIAEKHNITVVGHHDIFPPSLRSACLPTFNPYTVQMFEHRIPGLSEHFIHFEEFFFVNQQVPKSYFFDDAGRPRIFIRGEPVRHPYPACSDLQPETRVPNVEWSATFHSGALLDERFGAGPLYYVDHGPMIYRKSVCEKILTMFSRSVKEQCEAEFPSSCMIHWPNFYAGFISRVYTMDQPRFWTSEITQRRAHTSLARNVLEVDNSTTDVPTHLFTRREQIRLMFVLAEASLGSQWIATMGPFPVPHPEGHDPEDQEEPSAWPSDTLTHLLAQAQAQVKQKFPNGALYFDQKLLDSMWRLKVLRRAISFSIELVSGIDNIGGNRDSLMQLANKTGDLIDMVDRTALGQTQINFYLPPEIRKELCGRSLLAMSSMEDVVTDPRFSLPLAEWFITQQPSGYECAAHQQGEQGLANLIISNDGNMNNLTISTVAGQGPRFLSVKDMSTTAQSAFQQFMQSRWPLPGPWEH